MAHDSPSPFALSAFHRLTRPVRPFFFLTTLAFAACERPEQLSAPNAIDPERTAFFGEVSASPSPAASYHRIALRSNSNLCLDLAGSPSTPGVRTKIATCDANSVTQRFTLIASLGHIRTTGGLCIGIVSKIIANGPIGLGPCSNVPKSRWALNPTMGRIQGPEQGCITVSGTTATAGSLQTLRRCGSVASWSQSFTWSLVQVPTVPAPPPPTPTPASIQVTPASVTLSVGGTQQLQAVALTVGGQPVSGITFSYSLTSGSGVASVSAAGLVTAQAAGSATVRVATGTLAINVAVTVSAVPAPPPPPGGTPPPPSGLKAIDPTLPLDSLRVLWPVRTGQQWLVHAGDNLQNVLNQAQRGDEIVIDAGVTFTGSFVLPAKPGTAANGWILVRSANMAGLPPAGGRATARHASAMPRLVTPSVTPALATASGASGWYIAGIEMTLNSPAGYVHYGLVNLGNGGSSQNSLASVPSHIVLDRVYIHGTSSISLQRCVGLNSAYTAIVNSTLSQCAANGFDSQAIGGWNGPGPFTIENNMLEAAGENVMFGGADPSIANLIPSDIKIRGNHFTKQVSWRGKFTIKNLLETKNVRRLLIENNIFENCWIDAQTGFAIVLKSANQSGKAPWSQTSDVTFRYNIIRYSAAAFSITANPSSSPALPAARIKIEHNVIYEVGTFAGTTNGRMVQLMQRLSDIQVVNNTLVHNAVAGVFLLFADQGPATRLIVRDNVSTWGGPWGAVMGLAPQGTQALAAYAPGSYTFDRNVVAGLPTNLLGGYPTSSFYPLTVAAVGFVNALAHDYRLSAASIYLGKSTTNTNPGADVAGVMARTASVVVP